MSTGTRLISSVGFPWDMRNRCLNWINSKHEDLSLYKPLIIKRLNRNRSVNRLVYFHFINLIMGEKHDK